MRKLETMPRPEPPTRVNHPISLTASKAHEEDACRRPKGERHRGGVKEERQSRLGGFVPPEGVLARVGDVQKAVLVCEQIVST